ncbi:Leucine efflux protein [Caulifigura coniformis]|uniref:Leucine efflux protein n=1 Tax=Caulifigura coniformis TaxID=2527983 RepID=A0A517SDI9_9PLAN|nr:LysE family translocator [Caulifigura coniformis]QDT54190.1 Leucine efflux protein [Caulifigura coniformis]
MLGTHDLALFVASSWLLNITPGADTLYITTRSVTQGMKAGIVAALGISCGCCLHVAAAALGMSALLATSAMAFNIVKFAGAIYLIYIGVMFLMSGQRSRGARTPALASRLRKVFAQGFLTNILNPKVALFFLAFVPQFIEPMAANKPLAFLFLGSVFTINGTIWCLFLAWASSHARSLQLGSRTGMWLNRTIGGFFILLGIRLGLARQA